jgi:hypothetical protein
LSFYSAGNEVAHGWAALVAGRPDYALSSSPL